MGKYIKLFETHAEYESFIQTDYDKPNVSYCEDNKDVHYNPLTPPGNIITYKASAKLTETTSSKSTGSLNTTKFNTTIVSHAFENGVGTIEFEEDVTEIYNCAFAFTNITEIQLPSTLVSIGMDTYQGVGVFSNCSGLTSVTIPNSVTSIGNYVFSNCSGLTNITIGSGVTSIGANVFKSCKGLTNLTIPNSVTSIGASAFEYCTSLTSVTIPNSVTSIGNYVFSNCYGLTSVTIGDGVTSIGNNAFGDCRYLTSVTIGSGVTSIGNGAFGVCYSLTNVTIEATTPPTLDVNAFVSSRNCTIYVPSASVDTYKAASGWSDYASRIQAIP